MSFPIQQGLFQFDLMDHYGILGVSVDADFKEVRQRYLKIAQKLHPDTCKAKTISEKEKANQLLSKLVNPAYEHLSREQQRTEFRLVLGQIGKGVAQDIGKMTLASEPAKKLAQASTNIDIAYQKLLQSLAIDQYASLDNVFQKIAQISELNLVYLMLTAGKGNQKSAGPAIAKASGLSTSPASTAPSETPSKESAISNYIRRAQNYLDNKNFTQAQRELRDALRDEPDNSTCHALIGLTYLKQNQTTMARVHINRAYKASPKNPIVIECKKELDRVIHPNIEMYDEKSKSNASEKSKGGGFWGRFGGKKNTQGKN